MQRLTEKDDLGNWCLKGVRWEQLRAGQVITKEVSERLYGALCKLKDYEDTGCIPDGIADLVENYAKAMTLCECLDATSGAIQRKLRADVPKIKVGK